VQGALLPREITPETVLDALQGCRGRGKGATAAYLCWAICGQQGPAELRRLRQVVEQLRSEGHRICAHPTQGYYLATTPEELDDTCEYLFARAMTSLRQISAMRRVAVPDLRGQLRLPTLENPHAVEQPE